MRYCVSLGGTMVPVEFCASTLSVGCTLDLSAESQVRKVQCGGGGGSSLHQVLKLLKSTPQRKGKKNRRHLRDSMPLRPHYFPRSLSCAKPTPHTPHRACESFPYNHLTFGFPARVLFPFPFMNSYPALVLHNQI